VALPHRRARGPRDDAAVPDRAISRQTPRGSRRAWTGSVRVSDARYSCVRVHTGRPV
jgi:hypothetical protein